MPCTQPFQLRTCRTRSELIAKEDTAVLELTAVLICNGQDLTVELLNDKGNHEEGVGVFLRHNDKDGRLLTAELLGVNLRVEAQKLFQLRVQEGVQSGQSCGHDGCHTLLGCIQGGSGEPLGLVIVGKHLHELLELILAFLSRWSQQFLDDLEHGYDVPFLRLAELCNQQDRCRQESFGCVVEVGVLTEARRIHAGENDGLGNDLRILLSLRFVDEGVGIRLVQIHILVDQVQKVVAVGSGWVTKIDHRNIVAVALCNAAVVAHDVVE